MASTRLRGKGLNAGLRDVAALAQVLSEAHARGEDIGAAQTTGSLSDMAQV